MTTKKNPHAVELGRLGGKAANGAGFRVYWGRMTKKQRSEAACKAVMARWAKAKRV